MKKNQGLFLLAGGALLVVVFWKDISKGLGLPDIPSWGGKGGIKDRLVPDIKNPFTGGKTGIFGPPTKKDFTEGFKQGSKAGDRLGQKLGVSPTPTASDQDEYAGADKPSNRQKGGPFKGYLAVGDFTTWSNSDEAKKWYGTAAGQKWSADVQKYLASKGGPGNVSKDEFNGLWKAVPLPKSAPIHQYKDARGDVWYAQGNKMWKRQGALDPGADAKVQQSAIERQIEALKGRHG